MEIGWPFFVTIVAKLVFTVLFTKAVITILAEAYSAANRAYHEPTAVHRRMQRVVLAHQAILLAFMVVLYFTTYVVQPEFGIAWPELLIGCVYCVLIRRVATIDTRLKQHLTQQKQAVNAAALPPE